MKKEIKIPFERNYIRYSISKIDAETGGIFDEDEKAIKQKLKMIENELKITWTKGYRKGLIDRDNY